MIIDKISPNVHIFQLKNELSNYYENVCLKNMNCLQLDYKNLKLNIVRKKNGYDVSPDIPGYMFFVIYGALFVLYIVFAIFSSAFFSGIVGVIIPGLLVAFIVYWIYAEIYSSNRAYIVKQFVDSLPPSLSVQ